MIYLVFRQLLRLTLRIFFKHIHVSNVHNVPYNKPLVIAANHPGAFLDPVLVACLLRKPIYFLVRGDVFENKLVRFIFGQFNMIPVYRKDEGFENIEKNLETNAQVAEILKRNGIVVIFCEGYSATDRRLRTILKGTARICMQTAMTENLDVQIVPLGISYMHKTNFRRSVILDFSKPIAVLDYTLEYNKHPQKSFVSITKELKNRLQYNFVEIRNKETDDITELHLNYYRNTERFPPVPSVIRSDQKLKTERRISDKINTLYETNSQGYEVLKNKTLEYELALAQYNCKDIGVASDVPGIVNLLLLLVGLPFFILGFLLWGIPYIISKLIADKKVERIDFHDSVTVNVTNVLFVLFIVTSIAVSYQYIGIYSLPICVLLPLVCFFSGWYYDTLLKRYHIIKALEQKSKLRELRNEVVNPDFSAKDDSEQQ